MTFFIKNKYLCILYNKKKKKNMAKKITWIESYTTILKYSAIISDEEVELFETDEDRFFDEVSFRDNQELEWDKIDNEESGDFEIEDCD
jgi:hypothetical protein